MAALHVHDCYVPETRDQIPLSREGFQAALTAARDHRALTSLPPLSVGIRHDLSRPGGTEGWYQTPSNRVEAAQAASEALSSSRRRRADSAPTKHAPAIDTLYAVSAAGVSHRYRVGTPSPFENLGNSLEASRIQHLADPNAKLYTSNPPVAIKTEEFKRNNVLQAAAASMAREMYSVSGARTDQGPAYAVSAAQAGHDRMRPQKPITPTKEKDPSAAFKRAASLQDAAQKLASEKLARMHYEDLYHGYYGTVPPTRSRLSIRMKRTPSEADASKVDAEQSRDIRKQMVSLQARLNKLDEQRQRARDEKREKDRNDLMEVARRNVNAAIQDMELKVYAEKGLLPPEKQKEWEEIARERAQLEPPASLVSADKVHIGADQYVDRATVVAVARARIQPTLDEIATRTEERRARQVEQRLDKEERRRRENLERERDADTRAEEKRLGGMVDSCVST